MAEANSYRGGVTDGKDFGYLSTEED